jgi:PTS system mannose-specific IIA component
LDRRPLRVQRGLFPLTAAPFHAAFPVLSFPVLSFPVPSFIVPFFLPWFRVPFVVQRFGVPFFVLRSLFFVRQGTAMIGVVVVTHGQLATELLNAAETIVGDLPRFAAVSIGWHEDQQDAREEIAAAIARVQGDGGVLLLTDMFGGTPSNLGISFLAPNTVEVVTGVNLPMLIKAASLGKEPDLLEVARQLREHGRTAIWVASDLLKREPSS